MDELVRASGISYAAYAALSAALAVFLAMRAGRIWFSFPIILWLLAEPVLRAAYTIDIPGLPFDLQPSRFLLLYLGAILMLNAIMGSKAGTPEDRRAHAAKFEKYLFIFLFLVIVSVAININALHSRRVITIPLEVLTFIVFYYAAKHFVTDKMLNVILRTMIIVGLLNAAIATVQVLGNPDFLRTGENRLAFGSIFRAYGIFNSEYVFGGVQIVAIFTTLSVYRGKKMALPVVAVLLTSVLLTFHRLDMLIAISCIGLYMWFFSVGGRNAVTFIVLGLGAVAVIPLFFAFQAMTSESSLIQDRLLKDTVSGRFEQFGIVARMMPRHPLGLGSYEHPTYQTVMMKNRMTKSVMGPSGYQRDVGLQVHNGFLATGIDHGIFALLVFLIFLFQMMRYFWKRYRPEYAIGIVPFFAVLIWALSNVSNGLVVFRSYNVLMVAILAGAFVGAYQRGLVGAPVTVKPRKTVVSSRLAAGA